MMMDLELKKENREIIAGDVRFEMVYVEGGSFQRDLPRSWKQMAKKEHPVQEINVPAFYIGKYPVTQGLWKAVMGGGNPSRNKKGGERCPVEHVSFYDVKDFIKRLNALTGLRFRLPNEDEWEFAARGGQQSQGFKYSGGNDLARVGWFCENSLDDGAFGFSNNKSWPVGLKRPNELGLCDMSGNVWEWCQNYGEGAAGAGHLPDGEPQSKWHRHVVLCGGGNGSVPEDCKVSSRLVVPLAKRRSSESGESGYAGTIADLGFRLVLDAGADFECNADSPMPADLSFPEQDNYEPQGDTGKENRKWILAALVLMMILILIGVL